jgi:hypothetical protein
MLILEPIDREALKSVSQSKLGQLVFACDRLAELGPSLQATAYWMMLRRVAEREGLRRGLTPDQLRLAGRSQKSESDAMIDQFLKGTGIRVEALDGSLAASTHRKVS